MKVADAVLSDLYRPEYEAMELVEKLAYAPRVKRWKELGIMPGGAKGEVFQNIVKTSTDSSSLTSSTTWCWGTRRSVPPPWA